MSFSSERQRTDPMSKRDPSNKGVGALSLGSTRQVFRNTSKDATHTALLA